MDSDLPSSILSVCSGLQSPGSRPQRPWYSPLPWLTRYDFDGVAFVISQNLATMLVGATLLQKNIPWASASEANDIVFGQIMPGMGYALCLGNVYYVFQAQLHARATGRIDLCAQPFGISTPGMYAFFYNIIIAMVASGSSPKDALSIACLSNFIQGIFEILASLVGPWIIKMVNMGALLTSLAGIGFAYLLCDPLVTMGAYPLSAVLPLIILMTAQFANVQAPMLPSFVVPILSGVGLAWSLQDLQGVDLAKQLSNDAKHVKFGGGTIDLTMFNFFAEALQHSGIIIPTAMTAAVNTMLAQQLAVSGGDDYSLRTTMLGDGIVTMFAALMGCPFGFTVYVGHPALKKMGCKVGYNLMSGVILVLIMCSGAPRLLIDIIPVEVLNCFVVFVGLILCADALKVMPSRHWICYAFALVPAIFNWVTKKIGQETEELKGLFAIGSDGYIVTSVCWFEIVRCIVDRKFGVCGIWCLVSAVLASVGLLHAPKMAMPWNVADIAWHFSIAYVSCAAFCFGLAFLQLMGKVPTGPAKEPQADRIMSLSFVVGDCTDPEL